MQIELAETAGFCMGVRRAMDCALSEARKREGPLYTLGPLIHNRQAVEMLESQGIKAVDSIEDIHGGAVIIRAHGVPLEARKKLEDAGLRIVDATCPHVRYSQDIVRRRHQKGFKIIIAGDKNHAEVVGLLGFCDNQGAVVSSPEEARRLQLSGDVCLVAQTTFNESSFRQIAKVVQAGHESVEVVDTICRSTRERQREVVELCRSVDAMVVVGGKHSANTRRLAEVARSAGKPAIHVETAAEVPGDFSQYQTVGVTAGASTPNWITASVLRKLEEIGDGRRMRTRLLHHVVKFLTESTLYTGLAAVALTYAAYALQHGPGAATLNPVCLFIAFCYIFSVHIWNRLGAGRLDELNAPRRVAFYTRHRRSSAGVTSILAALSLILAARLGTAQAVLLFAAYLIGLAYNAPLSPLGLRHRRLKDLPASKDFFTATGWVAVGVVIPAISWRPSPPALILAALVAFILALVRSAIFDFTDIQGDRLLGRETLPALIGPRRTRRYLAALAGALAIILVSGAALGVFSALAYWLLPCAAFILLVLYPLFTRVVKSEVICPLVADGFLIAAGTIAAVWQAFQQ